MHPPLFRQEAINEKRVRLHGAILLAQPLSLRVMTMTIAALVAAAFVFLLSIEFQRHETVRGYVAPSKGMLTLRSPKAGVLENLSISIGNEVNAGDELFRIASDIESRGGLTRSNQVAATDKRLAEIERQIKLADGTAAEREALLREQRTGLIQNRKQLRTRIELKSQIVELAETGFKKLERLAAEQFVSEHERSQQASSLLTHRVELESLRSALSDTVTRISSLSIEISGLPNRKTHEISKLVMEKNTLISSRLEQQALGSFVVRAPVAGTITAVQAVAGQAVHAQAALATLLQAGSELHATLLVPSRAIGFLEPGAEVRIYVDAFPYRRYGVKVGRVDEVSLTAYRPGELRAPITYNESVYRVTAQVDEFRFNAYGSVFPVQPDMTLTADLVLDRRTLMEWLLEPLMSIRL